MALKASPKADPTSAASSLRTFMYLPARVMKSCSLVANFSPSNLLKELIMFPIEFAATCDNTENAGRSLFPMVSVKPSIASPAVLYCLAILEKASLVPAFSIAAKKSSVATSPACILLVSS